jgi:hypothetical protein
MAITIAINPTPAPLSKSSTLPRHDRLPSSDPFVRSLAEVSDQGERTDLVLVDCSIVGGDEIAFGGESAGMKMKRSGGWKMTERSDVPRSKWPSEPTVSVSCRRLRSSNWVLEWELRGAYGRMRAWTRNGDSCQRLGWSKYEGPSHLGLSCPRVAYALLIPRNFP